jgi:polyisoprenoid-binding protein YceI
VAFTIRHNGASNFHGVIYGPKGEFSIDPDAAKCSLDVSIPVAGILTGNAKRDQHLKSPDFFKAEEFPNITFKATSFKSAGEGRYNMTGDLTLTGVTKAVTVPLVVTGKGRGMGGEVIGVESTFTIKRTDFRMDKFVKEGALGDEVTVTVALEGGAK